MNILKSILFVFCFFPLVSFAQNPDPIEILRLRIVPGVIEVHGGVMHDPEDKFENAEIKLDTCYDLGKSGKRICRGGWWKDIDKEVLGTKASIEVIKLFSKDSAQYDIYVRTAAEWAPEAEVKIVSKDGKIHDEFVVHSPKSYVRSDTPKGDWFYTYLKLGISK